MPGLVWPCDLKNFGNPDLWWCILLPKRVKRETVAKVLCIVFAIAKLFCQVIKMICIISAIYI